MSLAANRVAGFSFEWDALGTAQVVNADGTIAVAGTRIQKVVLDDGTVVIDGGAVQPGADMTVATLDFLARGGDQYPYRGAPFTILGVTYQQTLVSHIEDSLGGVITSADYPVGGEGRIVQIP